MSIQFKNWFAIATSMLMILLSGCAARQLDFTHVVIDENIGGRTAIGDIDGDGYNDIAVHTWSTNRGKDNDGKIGWYRYPAWERFSIVNEGHIFGDGILIVDLDADGDNDVVTAKGHDGEASVFWYANPGGPATSGWKENKIATVELGSEVKDVEAHDMDHSIMGDIKDFNGDGKNDVVLSHSEKTGFSIMWYAAMNPKIGKDGWKRYKVGVIDYCHTLRADDMDLDGDIDIVTARSWDKAPIQLWRNILKNKR
jgi:hypothetical protein